MLEKEEELKMTKTTTKKDLLWFHVVITALIMFGFGFLPAPEPAHTSRHENVRCFSGINLWVVF